MCARTTPTTEFQVNALVGLHFLHDPQAVVRLQELAAGEDLAFQKAAIWAMGYLGEGFVPSLPGSPPRQTGPAHARSLASRDGANTPAKGVRDMKVEVTLPDGPPNRSRSGH